jgi:hypothetical protein
MTDNEIRNAVLEVAYNSAKRAGSIKGGRFNIYEASKDWGLEKERIDFNADYLDEKGLVKWATMGGGMAITVKGIDEYERMHKLEKIEKKIGKEIKREEKTPIISYCEEGGIKYVVNIIGGDFKDSPEDKEIRELEENTGLGFIENPEIIDNLLNKPVNEKEIIASFNPLVRKIYQETIKIVPDKINYTLLKYDLYNKKIKIYEAFLKRTGRI